MKKIIFLLSFLYLWINLAAQPWQQNDAIFNSSGVPSLSFSQPRFADLDADGDQDMILGSISDGLIYLENIGSATAPEFAVGDDIFADVSALDAEVGVLADLDNDGDLDLITGGYSGLNYYANIGTASQPQFQQINNFFPAINAGSYPIPDLADVNNDALLDLVLGFSESGIVKIYLNTGTATESEFSESSTLYIDDVGLYAYPQFADLDNDGDIDLLLGKDTTGFVYYQNIGDATNGDWQADFDSFANLGTDTYWNSPALVDLNGNGNLDLIYGTAAGPLHYYENNGTPEAPGWQENITLFGGVIDVGGASSPFFYDFDADGDLDMICGSQMGDIVYYENVGTASAPAWQEDSSYFTNIDHSIYSSITLGDVDADGWAEAIVGDLNGGLYFYDNNGTELSWDSSLLSEVNLDGWSVARLVDLDEDGDLDIVASNEAGDIFYLENQGTATEPDWVEIVGYFGEINGGGSTVISLGDLSQNGELDLVSGNLWGDLKFFENITGTWQENPFQLAGINGDQNAAPALVDLDGDGDLDLVLGNYDGTFSYYENLAPIPENSPPEIISFSPEETEFTLQSAEEISFEVVAVDEDSAITYAWFVNSQNMEHNGAILNYDFSESGEFEVISLVSDEEYFLETIWNVTVDLVQAPEAEVAVLENRLLGNYPNPFRPNSAFSRSQSLTISYQLKSSSAVKIEIFNAKGQLIQTLAQANLAPGNHSSNWNGQDRNAQLVSSGIYFYTLEIDGRKLDSARCLLLK